MQHGAAILKNHEDKFCSKENCGAKLCITNYKDLAISKIIVLIH